MRYGKVNVRDGEDNLCDRLKRLRHLHGFKQEYVAGKIGKARSTYGNYEDGNEEPGASAILALSELYGITPNDLLYDDRETIILDIQNLQEDDVEFLINTFSYMRKKNG